MKDLLKAVFSNQYVGVMSLWFTSILIDTSTGNRYVANVLLIITLLALLRALLKDLLGIETPYLKPLFKFLKFNRVLDKVDNTEQFYNDMEKNYYQIKDMVVDIKKKGRFKSMKKFLTWLYLNKMSLMGLMSLALIGLDNHFGWTDKWNMPEEWYYIAVGGLFAIIGLAIKGRGIESLTWFEKVKGVINEAKENSRIARAETKDEKLAKKWKRIMDAIEKKKANEKPIEVEKTSGTFEQPQQTKPLTKEEVEAKYGKPY